MTTTMIAITDFIKKHGILMTANRAKGNANMSDMGKDARHWRCTFHASKYSRDKWGTDADSGGTGKMVIPFSQGSAHKLEPTAADVLDCLASDAASIENAKGFEDWASDFGYDIDSRKAEKIYAACKRNAEDLAAYLGDEAYQELLWNTERE